MDWLGGLILIVFFILIVSVINNACGHTSCEGFGDVKPISDVASLPSAPFTELPDIPRPVYDPAYPRTLIPKILELKYAMDGFYERELPYIRDTSDSAVQLPISEFKGDYETVKAELIFLSANTFSPPQLKVNDIERMGRNLRFLQKQAHDITPLEEGFDSSSSPSPSSSSSSSSSSSPSPSSSPTSELKCKTDYGTCVTACGSPSSATFSTCFTGCINTYTTCLQGTVRGSSTSTASASANASANAGPITFTQLKTLSLKLQVEIARLQATGTTDPVVNARVNIYTQMKQTVDSLISQVENKTLDPTMIPIKVGDYNTFLPSLGSDSAGPGGLLFNNGYSTLSSLFNNYQAGDLSGSNLAETLFNTYGDSLTQGLSYSVNFSYTSPNDVTKEVAKSLYRGEFQNTLEPMTQGEGFDASATSPRASDSSPRASDSTATAPSSFNWKKKATDLAAALQKMGLEPGDFGCLKPGTQVGPDYSWRGHSKMVCTRAATHSDPALPEQIGCPPINWPGWRS